MACIDVLQETSGLKNIEQGILSSVPSYRRVSGGTHLRVYTQKIPRSPRIVKRRMESKHRFTYIFDMIRDIFKFFTRTTTRDSHDSLSLVFPCQHEHPAHMMASAVQRWRGAR